MNVIPSSTDTVGSVVELFSYLTRAPELNSFGSVVTVRTTKDVAQALLLKNECMIKNGCVRYFQIRSIGLDVYEVRLLDKQNVNTHMVVSWVGVGVEVDGVRVY
jgi:hypothetical protein